MDQSRLLLFYFCSFLITISIIKIEKSVDGVLGIRTWGRRMVGAGEIMELLRPSKETFATRTKRTIWIFS